MIEEKQNLIVGSSARAGGIEPELADLAKLAKPNCKSFTLVIIIIIIIIMIIIIIIIIIVIIIIIIIPHLNILDTESDI